jgi:hypothetical protein
MTDPNGWPDASKPGVPLNPERDGWHWLWADTTEMARWKATVQMWSFGHDDWYTPWWLGGRLGYAYLGPCHTPAEVAALIEAARREEREACAKWHDEQASMLRCPMMHSLPAMPGPIICEDRARVHERSAAAIRARGDA